MDSDTPAAAQISQADIIERQAETIARLKRQVHKGVEYKQLTKSKLKEAAARLKEYRVRVETLLGEGETLKKRLKEEENGHEKTKKLYKSTLNQVVKAKKQQVQQRKNDAMTQTQPTETVTRTSQTQLSGQVERVNKRTMVDLGVQTVYISEDTLTSRKRGRDQDTSISQDQLVPRLTRHPQKETPEDASGQTTISDGWLSQEPLQGGGTMFLHETSAALDAELAFSDSEDESGDTLDIGSGLEDAGGQGSGSSALDPTVSNEIDQELEMSSDEDEGDAGLVGKTREDVAAAEKRAANDGVSLLGEIDEAVFNDIDKELDTSSEEEEDAEDREGGAGSAGTGRVGVAHSTGRDGLVAEGNTAGSSQRGGLDPAVSNAIDKSSKSSDREKESSVRTGTTSANAKKTDQTGVVNGAREDIADAKRTLMSIDDELDDEFAALDADSETEQKPANENKDDGGSSSSSSSSDSDSSDSSDSDSDDDGDDPMAGGVDNAPTQIADKHSLDPVGEKEIAEVTVWQAKHDGEPGASSSSTIDKDVVVLTTAVEKKSVGASEDTYSPTVEVELPTQTPELLQLDTSAELVICSMEKDTSTVAVASPAQKNIPDSSQPSADAIDDAVETGAPDTQTSSDDTNSSRPALVTSSSSTNKPTEPALDPTTSSKQASGLVSLNSAFSTTEPGEQSAEDKRVLTDVQTSNSLPETEESTVGRARNADEANLEESQATSQKKVKLNDASGRAEDGAGEAGGTMTQTTVSMTNKKAKKKTAVTAESKEELRMKKSLAAFKQAVVFSKGEEADKEYTRRTIAVLVSQCSKFVDTHPDHVTTLCRVLADAYRDLGVSPMLVVRGSLSVFRTPRSRRLMQENKLGLSWLCSQVLTRLVCSGREARKQDASVAPESLSLLLVDECLLHLRGLLVEERTNIGDFLPERREQVQVQVATRQINVSHDKVFLAHICALHTHLCQATGQLTRSRVLLFDLVRDNPNIRGLYFAMVILEIYPAILEREFDQHCVERQVVLKETLQHALVVMSGVAAARQELLLHQSSITMLHGIADAIQMPELEEVDGSDPSFPRSCVEKLFDKLAVLCQPSKQVEGVPSTLSAEYYALAKSLEVCTAVYGLDVVTDSFSIERCQELFSKANVEDQSGIVSIVGHIAMASAPKTSDTQDPRIRSEQYVESVTEWLCHILSTDEETSTEDRFKLLLGCSTMCVELILAYSTAAGLESRRRVLCAVVRWFDAVPSDQLIGLPAMFVRRLRLAVVAARPQVAPR